MQVLSPSQVTGQFAVSGGDHNAFGAISSGMSAVVPQGSDYNTIRYEYTLTEGSLTAPVAQGQKIGVVRVWNDNVCLAQQDLLSATDVAEAKAPTQTRKPVSEESVDRWDGILKIVLGVVAVMFVFVAIVRVGNALKRRRRRRRKAAAKARQKRRS